MKPATERTKYSSWFQTVVIRDKQPTASSAIFVLLLITLALSTILFGAVDQATWVVSSVGAAVTAALWFYDTWRARALLLNASALLLPLLGIIAIGLVQLLPLFSPVVAPDNIQDASRTGISMDPYSTRLFTGRLVIYVLYFAAALTFVNTRQRLTKAVVFIITFGSLMAIFAILQRLAHVDLIYGFRETPGAISFGPFVNQHHFAALMEMTGGLTFGFLFSANVKQQLRIVLLAAAAVMGIAVVMTSSRGGLISFIGALLFAIAANLFVLRGRKTDDRNPESGRHKLMVLSGGAALLVIIVGTVLFLGADSSLVRGLGFVGGDITSGRSHFWMIALSVFADHPILGAGLDAFGFAFTRYDTWPGVFRVEQAHNDYLQTLADAGIIGFLCLGAFIYLLFKKGIATILEAKDNFRRQSAVGALCGCFGILIHSFFDFPLRTPSNAFFFLMIAAIATVNIASKRGQRTLTESSL